jgi:hypothetical protein
MSKPHNANKNSAAAAVLPVLFSFPVILFSKGMQKRPSLCWNLPGPAALAASRHKLGMRARLNKRSLLVSSFFVSFPSFSSFPFLFFSYVVHRKEENSSQRCGGYEEYFDLAKRVKLFYRPKKDPFRAARHLF